MVEAQEPWGAALCRVWLPAAEAFVRVPEDRPRPVAEADGAGRAWLTYAAAAARVAAALAEDALLAPIESQAIPLPHQIRALSWPTARVQPFVSPHREAAPDRQAPDAVRPSRQPHRCRLMNDAPCRPGGAAPGAVPSTHPRVLDRRHRARLRRYR